MNKPRIITICCSTKYRDKIIDYYNELTEAGYIVLADLTEHNRQDKFNKDLVDEVHKAKIDMSDEVHFLVKNGHMGESVSKEFDYAKSKFKLHKIIIF